jgi:hypothetical protein
MGANERDPFARIGAAAISPQRGEPQSRRLLIPAAADGYSPELCP